jgi:two-component system sensor histidine kinase TctE
MSPEPGTLRAKLLRWLLVPLSLVLLVDVVGSYFAVDAIANRIYDGELAEIARELLLHLRASGGTLDFDLSPDAQRILLLDEYDKVRFVVRAADGSALAGDATLPGLAASRSGKMTFGDADFGGKPVRIGVLHSTPPSDPSAGEVVVEVAETLAKRQRLAKTLLLDIALPQIVLVLVAGVFVWIGVRRGLAPLEQLRRAVAARSHVDMRPVAAADVPAELIPLVAEVNELMRRLREVLDFQGRFIADTAHQLRTPVAGLKAHIEVALRETTLDDTKRSLAHLHTSAERLSRLVSQLLVLARNEPSAVRKASFTEVDLNRLAFETTMDCVAEAYKRKVDLGFEGAERPVKVVGDSVRLAELINNLVDNAVRYSRNGGRVTVKVAGDGRATLTVSDDGQKIPVENRERVFERFYRLPGACGEGSGLGLAIVREIAALHGAEVTLVDDADGVGNAFTVSFPFSSPG